MRPRTLIVAVDGAGRKIWVSQSLNHATLCGVLDPSCASWRRETFMEDWPEVVHNHTARLAIYHADGANYVDLRNRTIDTIKAAKDIAAEVKAVLDQLTK